VYTVRQRTEWLLLAGGCILSVALSRMVSQLPADRLPQIPSDSVLTLVLGDARLQLSQLLFSKVEEYFHGGVRCIVCEQGLAHDEHPHEHEEDRPREVKAVRAVEDPWAWLDVQVHVQEHKHLEREKAVEMLPWVWASCRASPKNIEAFIAGSYVLSRMVGRPEDGVRLLEEGVSKNPGCAELDVALGELLFTRLNDPARAEPWFLSALRKNASDKGSEHTEEAQALRLKTLFYLGYFAKTRGDISLLREYVRQADAVNPAHVSAKNLHALLKALEVKE
jgi:hypothetical protein